MTDADAGAQEEPDRCTRSTTTVETHAAWTQTLREASLAERQSGEWT